MGWALDPAPPPGDLVRWAIYWQQRSASVAAMQREWRDRDAIIAAMYQESARLYAAKAMHLLDRIVKGHRHGRTHPSGPSMHHDG